MADPTAVSVILDPLLLIFDTLQSIHWAYYLSWIFRLVSLPLRLLLLPLRYVGTVLFVLLSPALYMLGYVYGCVTAALAFLASLEPLYTFFGAAASVGILTGLTLALSSNILTSTLGMQDSPSPSSSFSRPGRKGYLRDTTGASATPSEGSHSNDEDDEEEEPEDDMLSTSSEKDWQWLDATPSRRRVASGLLSQTILEEEDSD